MLVAQLAAVGHAELVMQTLLDGQTEHVVHPAPVGQFIPDGQLAPVMQLVPVGQLILVIMPEVVTI